MLWNGDNTKTHLPFDWSGDGERDRRLISGKKRENKNFRLAKLRPLKAESKITHVASIKRKIQHFPRSKHPSLRYTKSISIYILARTDQMAGPDIDTVAYKRIFLWTFLEGQSKWSWSGVQGTPGPRTIWISELRTDSICCAGWIFMSGEIEFCLVSLANLRVQRWPL